MPAPDPPRKPSLLDDLTEYFVDEFAWRVKAFPFAVVAGGLAVVFFLLPTPVRWVVGVAVVVGGIAALNKWGPTRRPIRGDDPRARKRARRRRR